MIQRILGWIGAVIMVMGPLAAEEMQGSNLIPSLGEAIPLEARGENVVFGEPVLISEHTLIPAGTVARAVFRIPRSSDTFEVRASARERLESSFSRMPTKIGGPTEQERAATLKQRVIEANMIGTLWSDPMAFRAILHRLDSEEFALIIQRPDVSDVEVVQFGFLDGLFLTEADGKVLVRGVVKESAAATAGLAVGNRVAMVNGQTWDEGLAGFQRLYVREKRAAIEAGQLFVLKIEGEGTPDADFSVPLPRSLGTTGFFDGVDP